jgi:hypothetical protein
MPRRRLALIFIHVWISQCGLCAILVFLVHVKQVLVVRLIGPDHPASQAIVAASLHPVLIFFLISGYLITLSIKTDVRRNGHFDALDGLVKRPIVPYAFHEAEFQPDRSYLISGHFGIPLSEQHREKEGA